MIQRIQTLFWLAASALLALLLCTSYATLTHAGADVPLRILTTPSAVHTLGAPAWVVAAAVPIPIIAVLCLALNAVAILLYRKARWQTRLSLWTIILQAILTLLLWLVPSAAADALQGLYVVRIPFFLPLLALALSYLALRGVLRDRDFLRRMDRLR